MGAHVLQYEINVVYRVGFMLPLSTLSLLLLILCRAGWVRLKWKRTFCKVASHPSSIFASIRRSPTHTTAPLGCCCCCCCCCCCLHLFERGKQTAHNNEGDQTIHHNHTSRTRNSARSCQAIAGHGVEPCAHGAARCFSERWSEDANQIGAW